MDEGARASAMENFATPPPISRIGHPSGELMDGIEWNIEISPIPQSRGSDIDNDSLPIEPSSGSGELMSPPAFDHSARSTAPEKTDTVTPNRAFKVSIEGMIVTSEVETAYRSPIQSIDREREDNKIASTKNSVEDTLLPPSITLSVSQGQESIKTNILVESSELSDTSQIRRNTMSSIDLGGVHTCKSSIHSCEMPLLKYRNTDTTTLENSKKPEDFDSEVSESPTEDLSSARRQVDESSVEFIERIRTAAHRRKVAMARSRDSLVAKEREHLRSIANSQINSKQIEGTESEGGRKHKEANISIESQFGFKQFKARPLPSTTFDNGLGGLSGVPKVNTKPPTTPFSPLLGSRRKKTFQIKALNPPKQPNHFGKKQHNVSLEIERTGFHPPKKSKEEGTTRFRARPLPASTGAIGHAGQLGVPKVNKRPVTVPSSPLLGHRRQREECRPFSSGPSHFSRQDKVNTEISNTLRRTEKSVTYYALAFTARRQTSPSNDLLSGLHSRVRQRIQKELHHRPNQVRFRG